MYEKRVAHDRLVPEEPYRRKYTALKEKCATKPPPALAHLAPPAAA